MGSSLEQCLRNALGASVRALTGKLSHAACEANFTDIRTESSPPGTRLNARALPCGIVIHEEPVYIH